MTAVTEPSALRRPRFAVRLAASRLAAVGLYAVAMAYVEAAAVLYLRTLLGGVDPLGPRRPLLVPVPEFAYIELGRESATMVMLAAVGFLAASTLAGRIGAFAVAMGVWDIFYYVFLWMFAGWPPSPLASDVLFLIPLPWWGPVVSPVLLAAVIVLAGALTIAREFGDGMPPPRRPDVLAVLVGCGLCLVAFMADALGALPAGIDAAFNTRAGAFPWPVYAAGLAVGGAGLVRTLTRVVL